MWGIGRPECKDRRLLFRNRRPHRGRIRSAKGERWPVDHLCHPSEAETGAQKILRTGMVIETHQIAGIEHLMLILVGQVDRFEGDVDIVRQPVG